MPYEILATSNTPALIVYVLDVSASMQQPLGASRRIDIATEALAGALRQMIFRSTKGARVSPRYRLAMFAYSDEVYDLLGGVKTVDQVAALGVPKLNTVRGTDTFRAFIEVEKLLTRELPNLQNCPAPLVCHITDGEYTGDDPEPIARRLMNLRVPDGNVLLENIFISDQVLQQPITDSRQWPGVLPDTRLAGNYANKLRSISSPLPKSYGEMMLEYGYHIDQRAIMLLPGNTPELVQMGFVMSAMSAATPMAQRTLPISPPPLSERFGPKESVLLSPPPLSGRFGPKESVLRGLSKSRFRVSISHPTLLSKRFTSPFLEQIANQLMA